jgi:UTP--glucose-1-phosphate uridylyltransferase
MTFRSSVRKAVIPAAGLGTRFLPATKAIPKEMLPIVDVPTIQLVIDEAVRAGVTDVIVVNGRGKHAIEDHFDHAYELEHTLRERGNARLADEMTAISRLVRLISVRQKQPLGLGHAVLCARDAVGDEPFAVLLGDDLLDARVPGVRQLADVYERTGQGVVALYEVAAGHEHMYGIVDGDRTGPRELALKKLIEKPAPGTAPSRLAIIGRYVLPPEIFEILAATPPGRGGEIQLTDALATLCASRGLIGLEVEGQRFDVGDRAGYVLAMVHYALRRDDIRDEVRAGLKKLLGA